MYKKQHISIFTLSFLALLLYPGLVKLVHVHHDSSDSFFSKGISLQTQEEPCPVCNFEFVSFLNEQEVEFAFKLPLIAVTNTPETEIYQVPVNIYFSLRAPPLG
ncbi:MAG: hypothetical protein WC384_13595 [Prolixibacteraceae bacterium]|jgi:hypothetical protein